jgi:hypothetical protein
MKFLYKWIPRGYMIFAIFWSLIYLVSKYSKIEVVEETRRTLPIPILLIIIVLSAIIVYGFFFIALVSWWDKIKNDKLGFYTFLPIYVLMVGTIGIGMLLINKLKTLLELNVAQFIQDLASYNQSMLIMLLILGSGIVVGTIGYVFEQKA